MLSYSINYNNELYHVISPKMANLFNLAFCGVIFIKGSRYKKFTDYNNDKYLIEF